MNITMKDLGKLYDYTPQNCLYVLRQKGAKLTKESFSRPTGTVSIYVVDKDEGCNILDKHKAGTRRTPDTLNLMVDEVKFKASVNVIMDKLSEINRITERNRALTARVTGLEIALTDMDEDRIKLKESLNLSQSLNHKISEEKNELENQLVGIKENLSGLANLLGVKNG